MASPQAVHGDPDGLDIVSPAHYHGAQKVVGLEDVQDHDGVACQTGYPVDLRTRVDRSAGRVEPQHPRRQGVDEFAVPPHFDYHPHEAVTDGEVVGLVVGGDQFGADEHQFVAVVLDRLVPLEGDEVRGVRAVDQRGGEDVPDEQQQDPEVGEVRAEQPRARGIASDSNSSLSEFGHHFAGGAPCLLESRWEGEDEPSQQKQPYCASGDTTGDDQMGIAREGEPVGHVREGD